MSSKGQRSQPPGKPPDPQFKNTKEFQHISNPTQTLPSTTTGPRYLIMKRINSDQTLEKVSPFLIQKAIDCISGKIDICKKLKNGTILLKTKNCTQASKLITLTKLTTEIEIEIQEHHNLNKTKGVIYSRDLTYLSDDEILDELKTQKVTLIKRIKKNTNDGQIDTGLFILTFITTELPKYIYIGYERTEIRPYIPEPFRCYNCFHFGHASSVCKKSKQCINCDKEYHFDDNKSPNEKCTNITQCTNCHSTKHNSASKKCPIYIKQKEINTIRIIENVDNKTAHQIYNRRHPHNISYASIINTNSKQTKEISTQTTNENVSVSTTQIRSNKSNNYSQIPNNVCQNQKTNNKTIEKNTREFTADQINDTKIKIYSKLKQKNKRQFSPNCSPEKKKTKNKNETSYTTDCETSE